MILTLIFYSYKSLPSWLRKYTPGHIYIKILEKSVPELKKMKEKKYIKQALKILTTLIRQSAFRQHKKSLWYAEKALILEKHENSDQMVLYSFFFLLTSIYLFPCD